MTGALVRPGPVRGQVRSPPSKSYTHRALVAAHLARRRFTVKAPLDSDDIRATARMIRTFGDRITRGRGTWTIVPGSADRDHRSVQTDCGASGTTLRFGASLAALRSGRCRFLGTERLGRRPMLPLVHALERLGARCEVAPSGLPLTVQGRIHGGAVTLDASVSSQFLSGLLLALPSCREPSRVSLRGRAVSQPYIDATRALLGHLGIEVRRRGRTYLIPGGQRFRRASFAVPGDASSAAYLWVAGAVSGGSVTVTGVDSFWPQADRAILGILRLAGAEVSERNDAVTVSAGRRRPFRVDLTACPDLYPLAGVLAATSVGESRLLGAAHVVHKESDRRAATASLARRMGARVRVTGSGLSITGRATPRAVDLRGQDDHRLVMSAAVAALAADRPSRIAEAGAVRKSYPSFWRDLESVGAGVRFS